MSKAKLSRQARRAVQEATRLLDTAVHYSIEGESNTLHKGIANVKLGTMDAGTLAEITVIAEQRIHTAIKRIPMTDVDSYTPHANTAFSSKVCDGSKVRTAYDVPASEMVTYTGKDAAKVRRIARQETAKQTARYDAGMERQRNTARANIQKAINTPLAPAKGETVEQREKREHFEDTQKAVAYAKLSPDSPAGSSGNNPFIQKGISPLNS